ncbi:MAG: sodium-translocating pyrophosphatase [bacterium]|nr:sodium-translocating pyrophosphatase [bacterium]
MLPLSLAAAGRVVLPMASEADVEVPDLGVVQILGLSGPVILWLGMVVCVAGLVFGVHSYRQIRDLPVHSAMREISELIYSTCKAYLVQQGKFLLVLWAFIAAVILVYFKFLVGYPWWRVGVILGFSLLGMAGSYAVAWYGIRINTFANSRAAFASLRGKPFPVYQIPMKSGMSVGMVLISVELAIMLLILLVIPGELAGATFIGFAIGESLGASALRIAGGIFTKIADIGSDLMKIVFKIKEDDARNPGVIADCTGDNAGDSVGPSADGFETYGVTGVALVTFLTLAVADSSIQALLLVWLFTVRAVMVIASAVAYHGNDWMATRKFGSASSMNFETPLSALVWLTSAISIVLTFVTSYFMLAGLDDGALWWQLAGIVSCGTIAGALIPELVKVFTSTGSKHTREVVTSARQGGASLDILSGMVAGNYAAFWLGLATVVLMGGAYLIAGLNLGEIMIAPAVFAFGLVAFGFLGMGPVTIAVDSYGPVTDNAQSVYELSLIEEIPGITDSIQEEFGITPDWDRAKLLLEDNDGAGNTFKATAKPVLIGTAVVGATTMIFSIIMLLTDGLAADLGKLSIMHAPFLLGLISGGAVIFWFTGGTIQAVTTGSYRAVEFIKDNIQLDATAKRASTSDSMKVVEICTQYAQRGMLNLFLGIFFITLAFAFLEPFFFIGYLISIALFGLYQANYMANAGGAWDNAKKLVEVDLQAKGTDLHDATIVGDTVGDPYKDTSSVAMNPVIKFTTLFGLLAVELAVSVAAAGGALWTSVISAVFLAVALFFIHRSFYGMRIGSKETDAEFDSLMPSLEYADGSVEVEGVEMPAVGPGTEDPKP